MSIKFFLGLYQNPVNSEVPCDTTESPMLFQPKIEVEPEPKKAEPRRQIVIPTPVPRNEEMKIVIPPGRPAIRKPNAVRVNGDIYRKSKSAVDDESWIN